MRKLFLSLFAALLIYASVQSVMAAEKTFVYYDPYQGRTYCYWYYDTPYNTGSSIDPANTSIQKNSGFVTTNRSAFYIDAFKVQYANGDQPNYSWNILGATTVTRPRDVSSSRAVTIYHVEFPVFNNRNDSVAYSTGGSFNPDNVIAGSIPYQNTFSSDRNYQPYINFADIYYGYEDFFGININGLSTTLDMQLRELAQVPNYTNSRVQLVYYVPTSLAMDTFISDYDMGSGIFMASSIETFMKEHPDFRYNNNLTYESHAISKNVDFSASTRFTDTISDYSVWGDQTDLLYNQLLTIYGNSSQKALYAYLLLMRYDYVSVAHYSDNTSSKVRTVYPAGFYYFNLYNYDNTLYKKRGVPVSPSVGTGSSAPTYDNPQNPNNYTGISDSINDSLQQQLTQSFNDSHDSNTTINNYYQGLDQRIDQFEDGTLNIDDTISNVVSVTKSVSHIGLIFGYLFNGFFPAEVITLLGFAFVLIPIVVIIKLIRG